LIKIDVEGFEEEILAGAMQTILRNKPVIVVEQQKQKSIFKRVFFRASHNVVFFKV
jgi:hypothetical protein